MRRWGGSRVVGGVQHLLAGTVGAVPVPALVVVGIGAEEGVRCSAVFGRL